MTRVLIPSLFLAFALAGPAHAREDPPGPYQRFEIWATAEGFLPKTITVTQGDRVQFLIHRTDEEAAPRTFVLGEFFIWERLETGRPALERFVASSAGEFTFRSRDGVHTGKFVVKPDR